MKNFKTLDIREEQYLYAEFDGTHQYYKIIQLFLYSSFKLYSNAHCVYPIKFSSRDIIDSLLTIFTRIFNISYFM